ncbi:hypothetical protein YB2330_000851 [Saitoella coloradoensis]
MFSQNHYRRRRVIATISNTATAATVSSSSSSTHPHRKRDEDHHTWTDPVNDVSYKYRFLQGNPTLVSRSTPVLESRSNSCGNECSAEDASSTNLGIILGTTIPFCLAAIVLYFLHRRHMKRVRAEELEDARDSLDYGSELPLPAPPKPLIPSRSSTPVSFASSPTLNDKASSASMDSDAKSNSRRHRGQESLGANTYLTPNMHLGDSQLTRESMYSLARSIHSQDDDNRYRLSALNLPAIADPSYHPPNMYMHRNDSQPSLSSPSLGAGSWNSPQIGAGSDGFEENDRQGLLHSPISSNGSVIGLPTLTAPSKALLSPQALGEVVPNGSWMENQYFSSRPSSPSKSAVESLQNPRLEMHEVPLTPSMGTVPKIEVARASVYDPVDYPRDEDGDYSFEQADEAVLTAQPTSAFSPASVSAENDAEDELSFDEGEENRMSVQALELVKPMTEQNKLLRHESMMEDPQEKAKRVHSVYREYFDDSKSMKSPPLPPMPAQYAQYTNSHRSSPRSTPRTQSPAPSAPPKVLEPLRMLPTPHQLAQSVEVDGSIGFAAPKRGMPSPNPSHASSTSVASSSENLAQQRAHNPLTNSYANLRSIPSPHLLRNSASFTSLDFAPPQKWGTGGEDGYGSDRGSEVGSVRSERMERGLVGVKLGAGRVSRLPGDLVFEKGKMGDVLRPDWELK